jgi:drug/metabolite transporter (DMT)-like permease
LFAIITARIVLKEKITKKFALSATISIIAAYFVTFKNGVVDWQQDIPLITAAVFATGAAFAWGSSTAFSKYNLQKHSHESITGLRFALTTIMTFAWIALTNISLFGPITPAHVGRLTMITFSTGLVALWIYYKGLKQTKAQVATILELAFPATGVIIDWVLYKNSLTWTQYVAMMVLILTITKLTKAQNA